MNICILSKFPPIQGGIAAKTYWCAKGYAEAGHSVHVVSSAPLVEDEYRITGCYPHVLKIPGVRIHEIRRQIPWHIPHEPHTMTRLIEKALEVNKKYPIDLIDTGYLVPFGVAGYIASTIMGIPYIIRHGGSDIDKFFRTGIFGNLLRSTFDNARGIITDEINAKNFSKYAKKVETLTPYIPDKEFLQISKKKLKKYPLILYIGKINWHFERKGLEQIISIIPFLPKGWRLKIIGQGLGEKKLRHVIQESVPNLEPFIPPWEMPALLRKADYVFCLSYNEPVNLFSNVLLETLFSGATPILNDNVNVSVYERIIPNIENNILRVTSGLPSKMAETLCKHWAATQDCVPLMNPIIGHNDYVQQNLRIIERFAQR